MRQIIKYIKPCCLLVFVTGLYLAFLQISCSDRGTKVSEKTLVRELSGSFLIKMDYQSIAIGKKLFKQKCSFCHSVDSRKTIQGPGLKGILKRRNLPISGKLATPENIKEQKKNPYNSMPSFTYLTEEEMDNIIAYLYTR